MALSAQSSEDARPIAIDLFAGGGGTTLALEEAGFQVPVAVELDPNKAATLQANHPKTIVLGLPDTEGDVQALDADEILRVGGLTSPPALVVGCPPCQGYSLLGSRNPRDPRNRLYEDFLRIVEGLSPRAVAFENVPGMATLSGGRFLSALMSGLEGVGFQVDLWALSAADYGVPQDRQRLFVVGWKSRNAPEVPRRSARSTVGDALLDLPEIPFRALGDRSTGVPYRTKPESPYAKRLRGALQTVTGCETTRHQPALVERLSKLGPGQVDTLTRHRRLDLKGRATTLTAGSRMRTACRPVHPVRNRVLTVREAARLASFPDWYTFAPETSEAWCQIGNAVPPLLARRVFASLRRTFERR